VRISPEQLAALERALSEQQPSEDEVRDEDGNDVGVYPKDKRGVYEDEPEEDGDDVPETTYMIPAPSDPSTEYVQIPLANSYENPYNFYQVDDDPSVYEEALRRLDEEQLRERIASLVDDINEQRRIARRRRR